MCNDWQVVRGKNHRLRLLCGSGGGCGGGGGGDWQCRRRRKGGPVVPIAAQAHHIRFMCCARRAVVSGTGIIIIIRLSFRRAPSSAYRFIRRDWHCTLCCDCDRDIDIRVRWPTVGGLRSTTTSAKRPAANAIPMIYVIFYYYCSGVNLWCDECARVLFRFRIKLPSWKPFLEYYFGTDVIRL